MRDFRFSRNVFAVRSRDDFVHYRQDAERYGYHAVFTADHLGSPAPFPPLVLAAEATTRLRVGTLVLNVPFWNAALLAREVAAVDVLTGGRGQADQRLRPQPRPGGRAGDAIPAHRHGRGGRGSDS